MTNSRDIEHKSSLGKGLARQSSRAKTSGAVSPIHPGFADRTDTSLGAPPRGQAPDASGPSPLDPTRTKSYPIPKITYGHKSDSERGFYDPGMADRVMGDADAARPPDDYAKALHTKLPEGVTDNG